MKRMIWLYIFVCFSQAYAYVATRTEFDQKLSWDSRGSRLDIYVNPQPIGNNTSSITSSDVQTIMNEVVSAWEPISPYDLDVYYSSNLPSVGQSRTVRFSEDEAYFGSSVVAITTISHSASTGKIYSADILINSSSNTPTIITGDKSVSGGSFAYLGDVLSHELGHFLGLGHSDVFGSSMVFSVSKGQHDPHNDDKAGLDDIYSHLQTGGTISGSVITGAGVAVFGAHVQAISYTTGKAVAGVFSESDGSFNINELPLDDSYLIYISPPKGIENLPTYYQSIQTKLCGDKDFAPSFFTKCDSSERGKPQVISLSSQSSVNVGSVTIRCDESVNPTYLYAKNQAQPYEVQKVTRFNTNANLGATHIGYFSESEISEGTLGNGDELSIDLTEYTVNTDTSYYLNIKLITKEIGTAIGLQAKLYNYNGTLIQTKDISTGSLSEVETDLEFDVLLSTTTSNNFFTVKLYPRYISPSLTNDIFGDVGTMSNKNATYLMLTSIKYISNGSYAYNLKDSAPYEDNYYCSEGESVVTARPNALNSNTSGVDTDKFLGEQEANALSCGTIDIDPNNNGSGGLLSFSIGLLLAIVFSLSRRKSYDFFV